MSKKYVPNIEGKEFFDFSSVTVELVGYLPAWLNGGRDGFEFSLHDGNRLLACAHVIEGEKPFILSKEEQNYPDCPPFMSKEALEAKYEIQLLDALQDAQMHLMEEAGFSQRIWVDLVAAGIVEAPFGEQECTIEHIEGRDYTNDAPTWRATVKYGEGKTASLALYPEECIPSFMKDNGCPFKEQDYGEPFTWHPKDDIYVDRQLEPRRIAVRFSDNPSYEETLMLYRKISRLLVKNGVNKTYAMLSVSPSVIPRLNEKENARER